MQYPAVYRLTLYFQEGYCQENIDGWIFINLYIIKTTLMTRLGVLQFIIEVI